MCIIGHHDHDHDHEPFKPCDGQWIDDVMCRCMESREAVVLTWMLASICSNFSEGVHHEGSAYPSITAAATASGQVDGRSRSNEAREGVVTPLTSFPPDGALRVLVEAIFATPPSIAPQNQAAVIRYHDTSGDVYM
jgi:hypothetical protein